MYLLPQNWCHLHAMLTNPSQTLKSTQNFQSGKGQNKFLTLTSKNECQLKTTGEKGQMSKGPRTLLMGNGFVEIVWNWNVLFSTSFWTKVLQVPKNPMYRFCDIKAESGNYSGERSCSPLLPLAVHLRRNAKNLANFSSHFFTSKDFILKTTFPLVSKIVTSAVFPLWSSIVYILLLATFFQLIHLKKKINHGNKCLILPIGFSIASIIFST